MQALQTETRRRQRKLVVRPRAPENLNIAPSIFAFLLKDGRALCQLAIAFRVRELSPFTPSHDNLKELKDSGRVSVGWQISRRNLVFSKPLHPVWECVCCRTTDDSVFSFFPGLIRAVG